MYSQIEAMERRQRNIRGILLGIIIFTLPFYCIGFFLWGTSPARPRTDLTLTPQVSNTPLSSDVIPTRTLLPSANPFGSATPVNPLLPTPFQFIPPVIIPTSTPFGVIIPTSTVAPTITPYVAPSNTPYVAPTNTPFIPSSTPQPVLPTSTPQPVLPTNTEQPPLPTDTPFVLIPASDTPAP